MAFRHANVMVMVMAMAMGSCLPGNYFQIAAHHRLLCPTQSPLYLAASMSLSMSSSLSSVSSLSSSYSISSSPRSLPIISILFVNKFQIRNYPTYDSNPHLFCHMLSFFFGNLSNFLSTGEMDIEFKAGL